MKKWVYVILVLLVCAVCLKSCVHRDVPPVKVVNNIVHNDVESVKFPPHAKTVLVDGVEYLQSQAPVGKFGGQLRASTIGEGPKTFNPFNSKDNTSSTMSEIMYDGLLTTCPEDGEPIPKLAKSFEINGLDYIIHLRRGVKWSDGKEITADDVVYTWQNIIFDGFGNTSTRDSLVIDGK